MEKVVGLEIFQWFSYGELLLFLILLILGIIIILLLKAVLSFLLPIVAAVVAWFLTHNLLYAGIAFILFALIQLVLKKK